MTTNTMTLSTPVTAPSTELPARRLRAVLGANAATSLVAGIVGLVSTSWLVDEFGLGSEAWTRLVSFGLVVFAVDVGLVASRATGRLRAYALAVSAADLAWVVATVAVLATVDLTTAGRVLATVMGIGVLDFALLQLWFRRQADHA